MARPLKQGLDYFPLDTDFLQDIKVRRLIRACGSSAIPMLIGLLVNIYRGDGYYLRWDSDMTFLISDEVGISEGAAQEFINKAVQVGFFDKKLYEEKSILTSAGIQRRFFEITERRKSVFYDDTLLLIDVNEYTNLVNVNNNSINVYNNSVNVYHNQQSKVKESKGKESSSIKKVKQTRQTDPREESMSTTAAAAASEVSGVLNLYANNIHPVSSIIERDKLVDLVTTHGVKYVRLAIEEAVMHNARNLAYITTVLTSWQTNGYDFSRRSDNRKTDADNKKSEALKAFLERRKEHEAKQKGVTHHADRRVNELHSSRAEGVVSDAETGRQGIKHILDDV
ncbi:Lin1244/Lin1753 domain-containing protein [Colibacter massiliensis]|uniref:Lin1244/Lin1753 domain-containing protein n=1 Tax=Colibacter massiliensis TaxID=1852379 RepID=UPI003F922776